MITGLEGFFYHDRTGAAAVVDCISSSHSEGNYIKNIALSTTIFFF